MPYSGGTWGVKAKERSKARGAYFTERKRLSRLKNPEKSKAHYLLNYALKTGKVVRPSECQGCDQSKKVQAHHDDYSQPLIVRWFCGSCHRLEHA